MQRSRPTPTTTKSTSCLSHLHTQAHTLISTATLAVLKQPCLGTWHTRPGRGEVPPLLPNCQAAEET